MLKPQIRKEYLTKRKRLGPELRDTLSKQICDRVKFACQISNEYPKSISLYSPFASEVDCVPLFDFFQSKNITCAFPRTTDTGLDFKKVTSLNQLDTVAFGINEPNPNLETISPEWVLVPGIAFTKTGYRIGFGYGHFDRALVHLPNSRFIALAYQFQILEEEFQPDPWDIKMHAVVTDQETY